MKISISQKIHGSSLWKLQGSWKHQQVLVSKMHFPGNPRTFLPPQSLRRGSPDFYFLFGQAHPWFIFIPLPRHTFCVTAVQLTLGGGREASKEKKAEGKKNERGGRKEKDSPARKPTMSCKMWLLSSAVMAIGKKTLLPKGWIQGLQNAERPWTPPFMSTSLLY